MNIKTITNQICLISLFSLGYVHHGSDVFQLNGTHITTVLKGGVVLGEVESGEGKPVEYGVIKVVIMERREVVSMKYG